MTNLYPPGLPLRNNRTATRCKVTLILVAIRIEIASRSSAPLRYLRLHLSFFAGIRFARRQPFVKPVVCPRAADERSSGDDE